MTTDYGVAISTTGDKHRLPHLRQAVLQWHRLWGDGEQDRPLLVTVDGDRQAVRRVTDCLPGTAVYHVGPLISEETAALRRRDGRLGVAVNKNTGLELLMARGVEHLFLCDDDIGPISHEAPGLHIDSPLAHSMTCWGAHRLDTVHPDHAEWSWPRGSLLYTTREVVEQVGGMVEAFGPGGHEHVEWSQRIHNAGLTPCAYPSPVEYADHAGLGAKVFWHAEDMPRQGEGVVAQIHRRRRLTSVRRQDGDWAAIEAIMAEQEGSTAFVPYDAAANGRESATLYPDVTSQGA